MMNKRIPTWALVSLTVCLLWGWAFSKDIVKSSWTAVPPTIDGVNADWTGATFLTEKSVKVDYAFQNDGSHLYILLAFKDPKYLSNIDMTGINIYFNTEGKKRTDRGIRFYKKKVTGDEVIAIMEKRGEPLTEQDRASLQGQKLFYLYDWEPIVKDKEAAPPASTGTPPDNPVYKAKMGENAWIYELKIPLAKSDAQPFGIGAEAGQAIKVGFEWGGVTEAMKKAAAQRGSTPPTVIGASDTAAGLAGGGGGGGGGGGARSGMPGGGGQQGGSGSPKQYDFWLDVQLAANK